MSVAWKGPDALRPLLVPLISVKVDPRNARRHPKRNLEAIRQSVREFGQRKPVVVREGVVVAGSGTLQAMDLEGFEEIAVVSADDLTAEQALAYGIADNQTGDLAEWSPSDLAASLAELPETLKPLTGFNPDELRAVASLAFEKKEKPAGESNSGDFATIKVTRDQYTVIRGAVAKVQQSEGGEVAEGRALELICAEFLSS